MADRARMTLYRSMLSMTLLLRRIPAVSMRVNLSSPRTKGVSMESRVVPAMLLGQAVDLMYADVIDGRAVLMKMVQEISNLFELVKTLFHF